MIGARKGGYALARWGKHEYKKIYLGGGSFPYGSIFMWAVFSLHARGGHVIFSVCVGGGSLFLHGGGGALLGLPPHNNFCGSLLSQKSFQIVEVLIFFEGAIRSTQKTCPPPAPIKKITSAPPPIVSISASHMTIIIR